MRHFHNAQLAVLAEIAEELGATMVGTYTVTQACTWTGMYNGSEVTVSFSVGTLTPNAQQQWILDNFVVPSGYATNPNGQTGPTATPGTTALPLPAGYVLETDGHGGTAWAAGSGVAVAPPSGVVATDTAAIAAAIASAVSAGGGSVLLAAGIYRVASSQRTDSSVTSTQTPTAGSVSGSAVTLTLPNVTGLAVGQQISIYGSVSGGSNWNTILSSANYGTWTITNVDTGTNQITFTVTGTAPTGTPTVSSLTVNTCYWADTSCQAGDAGSVLIGANINGKAPLITSVNAGVGFVTDLPAGNAGQSNSGGTTTITAQAITIVVPGVNLPDGVSLQGAGAPHGATGATTGGTVVYDSGSGITVMIRGGADVNYYGGRTKVKDMGLRGTSSVGAYGTSGTTAEYGIWVNNNDSLFELRDAELTGYYGGGLALDFNINSLDCYNTLFTYCGYSGASGATGGVVLQPFNAYASAAVNFYNCWFWQIYGWAITPPVASNGQVSLNLIGCQWNVILATSNYQSGSGISASGPATLLDNCYGQGAATYDMVVSYGYVTIVSGTYNSDCPYFLYLQG